MNRIVLKIIVCLALALFGSCESEENKKIRGKYELEEKASAEIKKKNRGAFNEILKKYDHLLNLDSSNIFTYRLQEIANGNNQLISFNGKIKDIIQIDTVYGIKIEGVRNERAKIAVVKIDKEKLKEMEAKLHFKGNTRDGVFVINVSEIVPLTLKLDSEYEWETKNQETFIYYDFDENLLSIKGHLVDYYLFEQYVE